MKLILIVLLAITLSLSGFIAMELLKQKPIIKIDDHTKKETTRGADLSYIKIVATGDVGLFLYDRLDQKIAEGFSEAPLTNTFTGESSGDSITLLEIQKPSSGEYRLDIAYSGRDGVDVFLYDRNGEVVKKDFFKNDPRTKVSLQIYLNKENLYKSSIIEK